MKKPSNYMRKRTLKKLRTSYGEKTTELFNLFLVLSFSLKKPFLVNKRSVDTSKNKARVEFDSFFKKTDRSLLTVLFLLRRYLLNKLQATDVYLLSTSSLIYKENKLVQFLSFVNSVLSRRGSQSSKHSVLHPCSPCSQVRDAVKGLPRWG